MLCEWYAIVATAIRRVSGIEWDSAKRDISFKLRVFIKIKEAIILDPIIKEVIKRVFNTKSVDSKDLSSKVEPIYMKNIGTKKPKPNDESFCGNSCLCSKKVWP